MSGADSRGRRRSRAGCGACGFVACSTCGTATRYFVVLRTKAVGGSQATSGGQQADCPARAAAYASDRRVTRPEASTRRGCRHGTLRSRASSQGRTAGTGAPPPRVAGCGKRQPCRAAATRPSWSEATASSASRLRSTKCSSRSAAAATASALSEGSSGGGRGLLKTNARTSSAQQARKEARRKVRARTCEPLRRVRSVDVSPVAHRLATLHRSCRRCVRGRGRQAGAGGRASAAGLQRVQADCQSSGLQPDEAAHPVQILFQDAMERSQRPRARLRRGERARRDALWVWSGAAASSWSFVSHKLPGLIAVGTRPRASSVMELRKRCSSNASSSNLQESAPHARFAMGMIMQRRRGTRRDRPLALTARCIVG